MLSEALRNRLLKVGRQTARLAARAARHTTRGSSMLWARTRRLRRVARNHVSQTARSVRKVPRRLHHEATRVSAAARLLLGAAVDRWQQTTACPGCRQHSLESFGIEIGKLRWRRGLPRRTWLLGCRSCGLVFTSHRPTPAELDAYYRGSGQWAQGQQTRQRTGTARVSNALFDVIAGRLHLRDPRPGARVLDIGCGDGTWLNSLRRHGWDTYGLETSTKVAFTTHHELTEIPRDASFDLVILHHVLEHLHDPMGVLAAARATLRDDGAVFVSVPNLNALPAHGAFKYCINETSHLQTFTAECLEVLLLRAGFQRVVCIRDSRLDGITRHPELRLRMIAWCVPPIGASADVPPANPLAAAITALRAAGLLRSVA